MTDIKVAKLEQALCYLEDPGDGFEEFQSETWVQYTEPNAPTHFRNGVLRSVLQPDELQERIAATIAHYDALSLPFRWMVTPSTRPLNTLDVLMANGFTHHETLEGQVADPANFPAPPEDDVEVVEVDEDLIEDWIEVNRLGFGLPEQAVPRFRQSMTRRLSEDPRCHCTLLARVDGKPAAVGSYVLRDDFAHFSGAATVKAFRRRGLYRRLILERMARLRAAGISLVTNHCVSTTSAPICKRVGFEHVCDFEVLIHTPPGADTPDPV